jgi:hypothetical protein
MRGCLTGFWEVEVWEKTNGPSSETVLNQPHFLHFRHFHRYIIHIFFLFVFQYCIVLQYFALGFSHSALCLPFGFVVWDYFSPVPLLCFRDLSSRVTSCLPLIFSTSHAAYFLCKSLWSLYFYFISPVCPVPFWGSQASYVIIGWYRVCPFLALQLLG